ncbi:MAG: PQQ-binding-like beta-propeller repeat protein [Candidatus Bathyarchaeota archaeon]|nr:PQQ-binding-like beta-propeller repeat protein [Candidatus Bathyarchaeota archaeon]
MKTTKIYTILLLAVLALGTFGALSKVESQLPPMKTYSLVDAIPDKVGVGETTLLKTGISEAVGAAQDGWSGLTIVVTKPDGTNTTLGPFKTDSTGSTFVQYTPDHVGTYTITSIFPQQAMPVDTFVVERPMFIPKGTVMLASSASTTLVVTEEPSPQYPDQPLPTEYWSRPIDDQLRLWSLISGNWVARPDNSIALYQDDAPETAHVLWTQDITSGGLAGGLLADVPAGMASGDAYEGKFTNSVIINGVLYYNTGPAPGFYGSLGDCDIKAVDLHTGETLWQKEDMYLAFGQVFYWNSYNVDGVYNYLWTTSGTTWTAWDPFDFAFCFNFTNVPSGTQVYGPSGEILIYQIDLVTNRLMLWNSTLCGLQAVLGSNSPELGSWASNVMMKNLDASNPKCYQWNVSIPAGLQQSMSFFTPIAKVYNGDRYVSIFFNQSMVRVWALNIAGLTSSSTSASKLFDQTWSAPSEWLAGLNTLHYTGATNYVTDDTYGDGVIAVWSKELRTHYGFSLVTGKYLWETSSEHYADLYGWGNAEHTWYFAYGKLYSVGIGGILYAYDLGTGKTAWTYNLTDAYGEPVTGNNWWGWITLIADGKIYMSTIEHSAENPLPRGAPYVCVNATDGSEIWRVNGMFRATRWGGNSVIGDSIIATMDTYDQRVYAIGKGSSQVTATAPDISVEFGKTVTIKGSVTDISPGTKSAALQMRFPNGVPAVSDASQSQYMLYVYKQFECPTNASGVPLTFSVLDANGNYRTIGTTTSDTNGKYSFNWKPDVPGAYTVYVTFLGSAAYYGSTAQNAFFVEEEPAATAAPTPTPQSTADMYFIPAVAGLFVLVIIVLVLLVVLMMKKRP